MAGSHVMRTSQTCPSCKEKIVHECGRAIGAGIDVERLALAMKAAGLWPSYPNWADPAREIAMKVAAEYARLTPQPGEPSRDE